MIVRYLLLTVLLAGCSILPDRDPPHMQAKGTGQTIVPEHLDHPRFVDLLHVPDLVDVRGLAGQRVTVRPPDPINVGLEIDQIVIRRLGEDNWVFVGLPPAMVWPRVLGFWSTRNLEVLASDPGQGLLDTVPARGEGSDAESLWEDLAKADGGGGYQFRVHLQPGVRSGSSEIRLVERQTQDPEERLGLRALKTANWSTWCFQRLPTIWAK